MSRALALFNTWYIVLRAMVYNVFPDALKLRSNSFPKSFMLQIGQILRQVVVKQQTMVMVLTRSSGFIYLVGHNNNWNTE